MNRLLLHHGALTFSAYEQGRGPLVLCLHGFPDHARSFRLQLPALADAGFRAVAPQLRGYESSSQPADGDYHVLRAVEDVLAQLDELGAARCHLVGHDWGALVGYAAAALAPERFLSLSTLSIAHPRRIEREAIRKRPSQLLKSWYVFFFQLRGLSEAVVKRADFALIEKLWRDWSPGFELPEAEWQALKQTFATPRVVEAALSYYRELFKPRSANARRLRKLLREPLRVPTLALTGALDGCMDTRLHDDLMVGSDFAAGMRVERIAGAGHFLHQERPEQVNRLLLDFLAAHAG